MMTGQFGYFLGSFAMSLFLAVNWLFVCRKTPLAYGGLAYGIAILLSFLPILVSPYGPILPNVAASLLCAILLDWHRVRARHHKRVLPLDLALNPPAKGRV